LSTRFAGAWRVRTSGEKERNPLPLPSRRLTVKPSQPVGSSLIFLKKGKGEEVVRLYARLRRRIAAAATAAIMTTAATAMYIIVLASVPGPTGEGVGDMVVPGD